MPDDIAGAAIAGPEIYREDDGDGQCRGNPGEARHHQAKPPIRPIAGKQAGVVADRLEQ
jgi:hypothetical protein